VNARVFDINGFSAHADTDGLMRYFRAVGQNAQQIVIVHGEEKSAEALARSIRAESKAAVLIPGPGESVTVDGTI